MKGHKIDFDTWNRSGVFNHFIRDVKCVISLTADVDVTGLVAHCKQTGLRFFPCFMYAVAVIVNRHGEFRMGYDSDGDVVIWDRVHPSYVDFHQEDESITHLVSRFTPGLERFYHTVVKDMEENKEKRAFAIQYNCPNTFDVSCLPWIHYKSLDLHVYDGGTYLAPVITWGKYIPVNGRLIMPLSIQIHHAAADGYHIARFYRELDLELVRITDLPLPV